MNYLLVSYSRKYGLNKETNNNKQSIKKNKKKKNNKKIIKIKKNNQEPVLPSPPSPRDVSES